MNQKSHITIWLLFVLFLIGLFAITYYSLAKLDEAAHREVQEREQSTATGYLQ